MGFGGNSMLMVQSAVAKTYATWNPSDKGSNITLSGGDLIATKSGTNWTGPSVRANQGKDCGSGNGKWYFEYKCTASTVEVDVGLANGSLSMSTYLVSRSGSSTWDIFNSGLFTPGVLYKFNASTASVGTAVAINDIIGVAVDLDNSTVHYYKNGTEYISDATLTGTVYPAIDLYDNNASVTANFGASTFAYSVPSGYNSGWYI